MRAGRRTVFLDIRNRVQYGGEQGLLGLAFDPGYAHQPPVLRGLHVEDGLQHGGAIPSRRSAGAAADAQDPPGRSRSVREPQRRQPCRSGRTVCSTRASATAGAGGDPEDRAQNMQSQFGKLLTLDVSKPSAGWSIAGARAQESLAILVRPRDGRPVHRAMSARADRGGGLHSARQPGPRELRLEPVRGLAALRRGRSRARESSSSPLRSTATAGVAASPAASSTEDRRGRPSAAATSTATTAAEPSGVSGWPRAPRRTFGSSRSG